MDDKLSNERDLIGKSVGSLPWVVMSISISLRKICLADFTLTRKTSSELTTDRTVN